MEVASQTDKIKALNDRFRQTFVGGQVLMTDSIATMEPGNRYRVMRAVQSYAAFTPDNDPHGEHDFGSFEIEGERFFWKIDYYDRRYKGGSEDPSDSEKTARVLTVMRAEEY